MQAILTMAGRASRFEELGFEKPKFLIDVFGKTLLEYSLESLPTDRIRKIVFVVLEEHFHKYKLEDVVSKLIRKMGIVVEQEFKTLREVSRGQSETAYIAAKELNQQEPLIIYNVDTYFDFNFDDVINKDGSLYSDGLILGVKQDGTNWSFAVTDSNKRVLRTAEKERISDNALVGFYAFKKTEDFVKGFERQFSENKKTKGEFYIAPIYNFLIEDDKYITYRNVSEFIPLGTPQEIFTFIESKKKRTKERSFNLIEIDVENQIVKKSSRDLEKIRSEYNWMVENTKSPFVPKVFRFEQDFKEGIMNTLTMEYVPYNSLSESFLYGAITPEVIKHILWKVLDIIKRNTIQGDEETEIRKNAWTVRQNLILDKTYIRFAEIGKDEEFSEILKRESIRIDGKLYNVPKNLIKVVESILETQPKYGFFHGDYCFPNILMDLKSLNVKLVDPRGESVGDTYYDIAKLRHSLSGYDLIINDFYSLKETEEGSFEYEIYWNNNINKKTLDLFDVMVQEYGYDLNTVKKIEALLFLSMIPLHKEDRKRQKMFFILATEKIQEYL